MAKPLETPIEARKVDFSLTRKILGMTVPVAMGGQIETAVGMAQLFLIGMLGPVALSAVGIAQAFTRVLFTAMMSISRGALTMVAQAIGANSMREASAAAKQAFFLLFAFSIAFGAGSMVLSPFLIPALTSDPEVAALGTPYLQVFFIGVPFMTLNRAIASCLQGAGRYAHPVLLEPHQQQHSNRDGVSPDLRLLGVAGIGRCGGGCGRAFGAQCRHVDRALLSVQRAVCPRAFARHVLSRSNWQVARRILKIGVPSGLQGIFRNGSGLVYIRLIAMSALSTTAVAAYAIGSQMEHILRRTGLSFGTVATAFVGRHLGAKDPAGAERHGWTILVISVVANIVLSLPAALFAGFFMSIFTDAQAVISTGVIYLYAMVIAEPFLCAANTSSGSLRGAGDTMPPLYYTLIAQWLVRLPVAYALGFTLGFDIYGIWAALIIYSVVQGALTVRKFAQGQWKTREI